MAIAPIWKDYIVTMGGSTDIPFRIKIQDEDGDVIYNGKSHVKPGENNHYIRINDICADYLTNALPTLSQMQFSELTFPLNFVMEAYWASSWHVVNQVQFLNNWSYDNNYNPATMGMAFPINGHIDARQWLIHTAYNADSVTANLTFKDGTTAQVIVPVAISADFSSDYNTDFARSVRSAGSGTAVFDLSDWSDVASVTINGKVYKVVSDCKEWVLYYINAYGGWDSFLIEGTTIERDDVKRYTRGVEYDNRNNQNRGLQNYVNEISKTYTMHSSWLSDAESMRMHHLMNSPDVYLYNINTGDMIPVVLTNVTTEYKTYKSNGGKLVNYTIEATLAQDRIRR